MNAIMTTVEAYKIKWKDDGTEAWVLFGIGDFDKNLDEDIFYWVEDKESLKYLQDKNRIEDFYIIE